VSDGRNGAAAAHIERRVATADEHRRIAEAVGWSAVFDWATVPRSLERSLFGAVAVIDGVTVGMGRVVGDDVLYFYIQDVAVLPAWQGRGIGQAIVTALLDHIRETAPAAAFVGLFAAPDAMPLYVRNGFAEGDLRGMFRLVRPGD
jgi:GNAT superfamily N-acetyltransferase